ncbi:hypothetical protein KBD61_04925 [Patescibacteria group bacterium]|nr:hypothetical protein [Patescibacteria group bacterium]MBP9710333.1 hypothetical protein [Patescibacteria group bacterium]
MDNQKAYVYLLKEIMKIRKVTHGYESPIKVQINSLNKRHIPDTDTLNALLSSLKEEKIPVEGEAARKPVIGEFRLLDSSSIEILNSSTEKLGSFLSKLQGHSYTPTGLATTTRGVRVPLSLKTYTYAGGVVNFRDKNDQDGDVSIGRTGVRRKIFEFLWEDKYERKGQDRWLTTGNDHTLDNISRVVGSRSAKSVQTQINNLNKIFQEVGIAIAVESIGNHRRMVVDKC